MLDKRRPRDYLAALPQMRRPFARVAQLVEHATENRSVGSSILSPGTMALPILTGGDHLIWES